ncbi:MAG: hypothetical protein WC533_04275 [Candidatus Pacearchaeota archaeon]
MSKEVDDILREYGSKISSQIDVDSKVTDISKEYSKFKEDMMPSTTRFERWARAFGGIIRLTLSKKDKLSMQKNLEIAHLDLTSEEVTSFAFFGAFITFLVSVLIYAFVGYYYGIFGGANALFLGLGFAASLFVFYYLYMSPIRLANSWRLKAGSQMVICILYIVVYMKHTSNLERAIAFASQHLRPPLSLDLKKIFWDVEIGRFSTVKESLDHYLEFWQSNAPEFVEAIHLIESSLYEPSNSQRVHTLEKSLQVILDGVYEKMLVFSREVRNPLTNIYMLGVILPTLGLALLPLASTLLGGMIKFYHVFILFNLLVPFFVFYLASQIMLKRPGEYGESEVLELNPDYHLYKSKKPYVFAALICLPILIIGLLPFLFQQVWFLNLVNLQPDIELSVIGGDTLKGIYLFDFKDVLTKSTITTIEELQSAEKIAGPFGIGALLLSLFIPISIALFFSLSYGMRTKQLIKAREKTKELEKEFTNSLFQLGNRLGDGHPAEIAFAKVAESTKGQKTADFFRIVNVNIHHGGMSLEKAIFDNRRGAIIYYPSQLIASSMRILLESVKKGLTIAAESLMSISEYMKNIDKVTSRLRDLLAEVVSDMKGNMTFLAPLLSGIVIGLTGMIALILNKLNTIIDLVAESGEESGYMSMVGITNLFDILEMIPPYYMQIAIGVYIIQVIFILTGVLVTIDSGEDKLKKTYDLGKNLKRGILLYVLLAIIAIVSLSFLASFALGGIGG